MATKHGFSGGRNHDKDGHPLYRTWLCMRDRCNRAKHKSYHSYGGRGITVSPLWDDFTVFVADIGPRPVGTTLDRINVDGNYEPGNVRWATAKEQAQNKRKKKIS